MLGHAADLNIHCNTVDGGNLAPPQISNELAFLAYKANLAVQDFLGMFSIFWSILSSMIKVMMIPNPKP